MNRKNKNIKSITVRKTGVHVFDCTPESRQNGSGIFYSLNIQLVQELGFKSTAFLLKLKSSYKNGTIYNFSYRKIAKLVGCSPVLAKKNIQILIDNDLLKIHGDNLCFVKFQKIKRFEKLKQEFVKILLTSNLSFKEYKEKCALMLLERKSSQQRFKAFKDDQDSIKPLGSQSEIDPKKIAIGYRKMAEYLGVSVGNFSGLVKIFKSNHGLKAIKIKEKVCNVKGNFDIDLFKDCHEGYFFRRKNGDVIKHYGTIFSYSSNLDYICSRL